jgi:hypothetical protein
MSDTGAGGTGNCWALLASCNDEPQSNGRVGHRQCRTWTDHTSRVWPAGRREDDRTRSPAIGKHPHRALSQAQPPGAKCDALRRNHRGVGRYLSSFEPKRELVGVLYSCAEFGINTNQTKGTPVWRQRSRGPGQMYPLSVLDGVRMLSSRQSW